MCNIDMQQAKQRIEWVDIYKALAIVLMVVGHATGKFNGYIYQFHMAAFFFISGITANIEKKHFSELFFAKFFSLILPLLVFIVSGTIFLRMIPEQLRGTLFNLPFLGVKGTLLTFFRQGDIYIQFLGACWFLEVLFGIFFISKFLFDITPSKLFWFTVSLVLYVIGYHVCRNKIAMRISFIQLDLVFVCQFFFITGYLLKNFMLKIEKSLFTVKKMSFFIIPVILLINLYIFWFMKITDTTVDYANRKLLHIFTETFAAFNGICFLTIISILLDKICHIKIKSLLLYVGGGTISVLFFHFAIFKVLLVLFYKYGKINLQDVSNVVPPASLSNYFILFAFAGIFGSHVLWELCKRIPVLNCFVAGKKSKQVTKKVCNSFVIKNCNIVYDKITGTIKVLFSYLFAKTAIKPFVLSTILFSLLFSVRFIPGNLKIKKEVIKGEINISFPYKKGNIYFSDGWLPQIPSETYRWVAKESVFYVSLANQHSFSFEGYVPEDFKPLTKMEVYVNDNLVRTITLKAGNPFSAEIDIGQFANYESQNEFKFIFDWERIPQKADADQRTFSALISKMILC